MPGIRDRIPRNQRSPWFGIRDRIAPEYATCDTLGMRFLFQAPPGLGFFDCAGVRLMLDAPAKAQSENYSSVIYYKVPDLDTAFETLSSRGVLFEEKPHLIAKLPDHELWMAFFRDPDGNLLALMSEVRQ